MAGLAALALFAGAGAPAFAYSVTDPSAVAAPAALHADQVAAMMRVINVDNSTTTSPSNGGAAGLTIQVAPSAPARPGVIAAPFFTQFDGTVWAESNCGPAALAMALGALDVHVDPIWVRRLANIQMSDSDPNNGTSWESLAAAAKDYNIQVQGLYSSGHTYKSWSIDDLKNELAQGHPVLLLTHYPDLPDHGPTSFTGDHYVLALGFDPHGNLVFNDSANRPGSGTATMSPDQLATAWSNTSSGLVRTAMALVK